MDKRIVYTRPNGGVNVYQPAPEFMAWLSCGGYWKDKPRGWVDSWIERRTAEGRQEWAVARLAGFAQQGGCTTAEAFGALRDFDCIHLGSGCEAWNLDELPLDRWFRSAWRRSHNGGPIDIEMGKAREIHFNRIRAAAKLEKAKLDDCVYTFDAPLKVDWGKIRDQILKAEEAPELRRIWPDNVPMISRKAA